MFKKQKVVVRIKGTWQDVGGKFQGRYKDAPTPMLFSFNVRGEIISHKPYKVL